MDDKTSMSIFYKCAYSNWAQAWVLGLFIALLSITGVNESEANPMICGNFQTGSVWDFAGDCSAPPQTMCTVCHNTTNGGPGDFNAFGSLVQSNGSDPTAAAVLSADTDGDGWTNGQERDRGTFPADAGSLPAAPDIDSPTVSSVNFDVGDVVMVTFDNMGGTDTVGFIVDTEPNDSDGGLNAVSCSESGGDIDCSWNSAGFTGSSTSITVTAFNPSDDVSQTNSSQGTINLNVNAAATDDNADVDVGSFVNIDVLDNDLGGGINISTGICDDTQPQYGTISVIAGPMIRYTHTSLTEPDPSVASIDDTFSYCATGGGGNFDDAIVTVTISTQAPVATADAEMVDAGSSVDIAVTTNDTGGGQPVTITIETLPTNGTLNVNGSDVTSGDLPLLIDPIVDITYTPNPGFLGPTDEFTYFASNGGGDSSSVTVTIDVTFTSVLGNNAIENSVIDPALIPVAKALDTVCVDLDTVGLTNLTDDQSDLFSNCVVLSTVATNGGTVEDALNAINNKHAFAASTVGIRIAQTGLNNINERLAQIRGGGGGGFNANGLKVGYKKNPVPLVQLASLIQNTTDLYFPKNTYEPQPWGIFINGGFSLGDQNATSNEPGFEFDSRGVTFGGDYRFSDKYIFGAAFTFSNTLADQFNNAGEIGINGRSATLYGIMTPAENMFFEWQVGYGTNNYESKRNISFSAGGLLVDRQAIASYDGYQVSVLGAFVYDLHKGNLTFSPNIELSYIHGGIDAYDETRAGGLNLAVADQTYESFFASVGGRVSYSIETIFGKLVPRVQFEINHEFLDDVRTISQNFVSAPGGTSAFQIRSDKPVDRDFVTFGAGMEAHFGEQVTGFVDYSTIQALENVSSHTFSAGVRVRF
jgi:outer membrane autotransporter protein